MAIDRERARQYLKGFEFRKLFIEELGWDRFNASLDMQVDGAAFTFQGVAEKRGVVVLLLDSIPESTVRAKLEKQVSKQHFEHLIVFVDQQHGRQVWQWVRKEKGKPKAVRAYKYTKGQAGELLLQKLESLAFTLEQEETLTLTDVIGGLKAFDVEKVTKKFYERFKTEHDKFLGFIEGIPDKQLESWYASVMINRLMFLYFIQEKGFLDGDRDYLRNKLEKCKAKKPDSYYKDFLCPLFFQGFARRKSERPAAISTMLGEIPYLNGGLFQPHQIEELHGKQIVIADEAFERLFNFFKEYDWHLDERENRDDKEINPDVLGYIFEKYINNKQMGAYYTKEDITGYISQNTIIPFLLDKARKDCPIAFKPEGSVWQLLKENPDDYIYDAMKRGSDETIPAEIAAGIKDVSKRTGWNRPTPAEFALPTEIWRETIDRLQRYEQVKVKLAGGEVHEVNDLVTLNLNIREFAKDVILDCEGPELLRALWNAVKSISVLDPTCGSGAFLFAALNILRPLYEACLIRMEGFVKEMEAAGPHHPKKYQDFKDVLTESARHPKQDYFILKSIIVNNLYGVDIMEEAVEICKLRLFLKLVAQVDSQDRIEPLPDIDFNIRAGNTLVGYARYEDVQKAVSSKFDFGDAMSRIEDKAKTLDAAVEVFRKQQTQLDGTVTHEDKAELRRRFLDLETELNDYLSGEYGIKKSGIKQWKESHKPFHWFCDFHRVISDGGFDVIIGNPPYVEYRKITGEYRLKEDDVRSLASGNLYAFCMERCTYLIHHGSRFGMIVPAGVMGLDDSRDLRKVLTETFPFIAASTYAIRPSKLFDGVDQRLCIFVAGYSQNPLQMYASKYHHWNAEERATLFARLSFEECLMNRLGRLPQIGTTHARNVLTKIEAASGIPIASTFSDMESNYLNYHRSPRYWIRSMNFEPYFRSASRSRSEYHLIDLRIRKKNDVPVVGSLLNSSLFFFWFIVVGNGRNITGTDVSAFPMGEIKEASAQRLAELFSRLMKDYKAKSFTRVRKDCEFQEFRPSLSKPILDEIDGALARHYGFTDEELDFIVNYDIKYRLGADTDEG
jgi:type I restriction-modification system DNA methylase subunit